MHITLKEIKDFAQRESLMPT